MGRLAVGGSSLHPGVRGRRGHGTFLRSTLRLPCVARRLQRHETLKPPCSARLHACIHLAGITRTDAASRNADDTRRHRKIRADPPVSRLRSPRDDGAHARRSEAVHGRRDEEGRLAAANPAVANAVRRAPLDASRRQSAHRGYPRNHGFGFRRRRLHPRLPGHPRAASLGRRVGPEPAVGRAGQRYGHRRVDRCLRHHRLAGEEHAGIERQGRCHRLFVSRFHHPHGGDQSASGAQGGRTAKPDGRWLDG